MEKKPRLCTNCYQNEVNEEKQTFIYRDWEGIKHDACLTPICDKCIASGTTQQEGDIQRLYLDGSRVPKDEPQGYWGMLEESEEPKRPEPKSGLADYASTPENLASLLYGDSKGKPSVRVWGMKPFDYHRILQFAAIKHEGQFRQGGAPYITHPIAVAELLKSMGCDPEVVAAGFLHDIVEDTDATDEEIITISNKNVLDLVKQVTKPKDEPLDMVAYIGGMDVRAVLLKLADRIHNIQCAVTATPSFRRKYLKETEEYYIPLSKGTVFEGMLHDVTASLRNLVESESKLA